MNKTINTGILSYGMSGRVFHAPFVATSPFFNLHSVTERTEKRAGNIYPYIKSYNSIEAQLADPAIELIIVNTPNNTHYEYTKMALMAGKHVLVEKPFCATYAEARELYSLSRREGRKLMVYQNRRWDADFLRVRDTINSGDLGQIVEAHFRFDRYKPSLSAKLFKETAIPASGLSYDLGPHILDQAIAIFGKPTSFTKTLAVHRAGSMVDDYFNIHLRYDNGINVYVTGSLMTVGTPPAYIVRGSKGSLRQYRTDQQEAQLDSGLSPLDKSYGKVAAGPKAVITKVLETGKFFEHELDHLDGNYDKLFHAVYNYIMLDEPFPITEDEILTQIQILEAN